MEEEARNETARETDKATTLIESPQLSADGSSGDWNNIKDYMKIKSQKLLNQFHTTGNKLSDLFKGVSISRGPQRSKIVYEIT